MAQRVVHRLEAVEVDEEDSDATLVALGMGERLVELVEERGAVRQSGELVVQGPVAGVGSPRPFHLVGSRRQHRGRDLTGHQSGEVTVVAVGSKPVTDSGEQQADG